MSQSGRSLTNSPPPPCLAPVRSPSHTNDSICLSVRWEPFSPGQMRPLRQTSMQRAHQGLEFLTGLRYLWDLRWNQILNLAPDSPWDVGEIPKGCVCICVDHFGKGPIPNKNVFLITLSLLVENCISVNIQNVYFSLVMWMLRKHSILQFFNHYGNVPFELVTFKKCYSKPKKGSDNIQIMLLTFSTSNPHNFSPSFHVVWNEKLRICKKQIHH